MQSLETETEIHRDRDSKKLVSRPRPSLETPSLLNLQNFRIRIGYGYLKNLSDLDQELKNQYPLTSAA